MARAIAPTSFALRQRVAVYGPWVIMAIFALAVFLVLYAVFYEKPSIGRIAEFVVFIVIIGGASLGYAAWNISQLKAGLVPTPKQSWHVQLCDGAMVVQTSTYTTSIPLTDVKTLTLVDDDSWDKIRGMETMCLVLRLASGGKISIPQSSTGFKDMLATLRRSHAVQSLSVSV